VATRTRKPPDTSETAWYSTYSYLSRTWTWPKYQDLFAASGELMARQSDEISQPGGENVPAPVLGRWTAQNGWEWAPFAGTWQSLGQDAAPASQAAQGMLIGIGIIVLGFALLASGRRAS
jgi:hypothetical protein